MHSERSSRRLRSGPDAGPSPVGRLSLQAKGANLPFLPMPLAPPVKAQIVAGDTGACWDASYASPLRNTGAVFKAS